MSEWALSNLELTRKLRELEEKLDKLDNRLKAIEARCRGRKHRRHKEEE